MSFANGDTRTIYDSIIDSNPLFDSQKIQNWTGMRIMEVEERDSILPILILELDNARSKSLDNLDYLGFWKLSNKIITLKSVLGRFNSIRADLHLIETTCLPHLSKEDSLHFYLRVLDLDLMRKRLSESRRLICLNRLKVIDEMISRDSSINQSYMFDVIYNASLCDTSAAKTYLQKYSYRFHSPYLRLYSEYYVEMALSRPLLAASKLRTLLQNHTSSEMWHRYAVALRNACVYQKADSILENLHHDSSSLVWVIARVNLSKSYSGQRRFDEALQLLGNMLPKAQLLNNLYLEEEILEEMQAIVKKTAFPQDVVSRIQGQYIQFLLRQHQLDESAFYDYETFGEKLDQLRSRQADLTKRLNRSRIRTLIIIGLATLGALFLFFTMRFLSLRRRHAIELSAFQHRIQGLNNAMDQHLVFNILGALKHSINHKSKEKSTELLQNISKFIRQSLTRTQSPLVPLDLELAYLDQYMKLEQERFDKDIDYHINNQLNKDYFIPQNILQPLIENAVLHGMDTDTKERWFNLEIKLNEQANRLEVQISNPYDPVAHQARKSSLRKKVSLGLQITRKRIKSYSYLLKRTIDLVIDYQPDSKTVVTRLELPVIRTTDKDKFDIQWNLQIESPALLKN
ncbi:MAG: histidine kinase [Bacteroidia bacterium]|nr:histidine kinase [Bacteroidia bacterium]